MGCLRAVTVALAGPIGQSPAGGARRDVPQGSECQWRLSTASLKRKPQCNQATHREKATQRALAFSPARQRLASAKSMACARRSLGVTAWSVRSGPAEWVGFTVARAVFLSRPRPRFALHGAQRLTVQGQPITAPAVALPLGASSYSASTSSCGCEVQHPPARLLLDRAPTGSLVAHCAHFG